MSLTSPLIDQALTLIERFWRLPTAEAIFTLQAALQLQGTSMAEDYAKPQMYSARITKLGRVQCSDRNIAIERGFYEET